MLYEDKIWLGTGSAPVCLLPQMANRHGLIAGATGTGKTVTLKVMAEGFSEMGVPVFLSDAKGDLSGMVLPGQHRDGMAERLAGCGVPSFQYRSFPTVFWDVYGEKGHPVRATVSEMGPLLLSRMLGLNETQTGVMNILFRVADDEGMLLLDIKDLKAMLAYLGEHAKDYTLNYGHVSSATIGAIQRAVAMVEDQGGDLFFGEPALNIADWMQLDETGRGVINILAADKLAGRPTMYSTFLLWMLSELYELLPEVGDCAKPRMVFFFDEAHLLFDNCSKSLLEKVEQVVRLIRSKGVGVYFVTQNPADIPVSVLGQLGNCVLHALRAYTPLDQRAVKAAAQAFRPNPAFDTEEVLTTLGVGEALVSCLDATGVPGMVERATILPPQSLMGTAGDEAIRRVIENSPFFGVYDEPVDRQSAYEMLVGMFQKEQPRFTPEQVQISTAQPTISRPQGFMVFDVATGQYVQKPIPTMTPVPAAPVPQPVAQQAQPAVQQMPVMVYDPASGQYIQQMMPMQLNPVTGNYVPAPQQPAVPAYDAKAAEKAAKDAEKERKAAEKAEKERIAAERRQRADELREERAERARRNDSVLGRMKNTAISTVSREVTRQFTRGIMGSVSSIFGGKR